LGCGNVKQVSESSHAPRPLGILPDDGLLYGQIAGCNGVYATATTLEDCREQIEEVLEEWILFRVSRNLVLPVIDGIELSMQKAV